VRTSAHGRADAYRAPRCRVTAAKRRRSATAKRASADCLATTASLATSRERNTTTTIRVRQDEAQGSKARSCPFLGLHTRGHKINLDRDTIAGRRAAVRSRRDRERSVLTTQCSVVVKVKRGARVRSTAAAPAGVRLDSKVGKQETAFAWRRGAVKLGVKAGQNRVLATEQTNGTKASIGIASWEPGIT
jgi:hypothetical protein